MEAGYKCFRYLELDVPHLKLAHVDRLTGRDLVEQVLCVEADILAVVESVLVREVIAYEIDLMSILEQLIEHVS